VNLFNRKSPPLASAPPSGPTTASPPVPTVPSPPIRGKKSAILLAELTAEKHKSADLARQMTQLSDQLQVIEAENLALREQEMQIIIVPSELPVISKLDVTQLHATMYPLTNQQTFEDDPDLYFSRVVIVSKREHDKEYDWGTQTLLLDDGALVEGQTAKCWLARIGWIQYDINEDVPVLYSLFTGKDVQEILDLVIDANALQSLREEVLAGLLLNLQNDFKKYRDMIETAQNFQDTAEKREIMLRKKVRTDLLQLDHNIEESIPETGYRLEWWGLLLLGIGWLGFLLCLGLLIGAIGQLNQLAAASAAGGF
jgi:hypothetical protein